MPSVGATTLAIKAFFHPEQAQGITETYELHLGNEILQVRIKEGVLQVQQGQNFKADVIFHTEMPIFMNLFSGQLAPDDALAGGLIRIEGDQQALKRFLTISAVQGAE